MSDEHKSPTDASPAEVGPAPVAERQSKLKRYVKRFGVVGFLFFLIKGLLWLIVPVLIAKGLLGGG